MCGRTSLFVPAAALEDRFDARAVRPLAPRYNIAPGDDLAAITNDAADEIDLLEWGLLPAWVDDPESFPTPINARAETVAEKPSFRDAFESRRCLVLADGFYEWSGDRGRKQPYRVTRADEAPFAMAGLWEQWDRDGTLRETVTVITTDANDLLRPIHDRMPVILAEDEEAAWLDAPDESLLDPFPCGELRSYPVSTAVNDPGNDSPEVIEPVDDPQTGLGDFT